MWALKKTGFIICVYRCSVVFSNLKTNVIDTTTINTRLCFIKALLKNNSFGLMPEKKVLAHTLLKK